MKLPRVTAIDFEAYAIEGRPCYPPRPVGVSIGELDKPPTYYAWGHEGGENGIYRNGKRISGDPLSAARTALDRAYKGELLFHNAKFDLDVADVHLDLPIPSWDKIHDTMLLLFLHDPNQKALGLKLAARDLLGMPTEERDEVAAWLCRHQPVKGVRITPGRAVAYIAYAPGSVVAPYANGDVIRTIELFKLVYPRIAERMLEPYNRERRLLPILLQNEREGVRVDEARLEVDVDRYTKIFDRCDVWVRQRLDAPGLDVGSGDQLAPALVAAGVATPESLGQTPTGKLSTAKDSIDRGVSDDQLKAVLRYRGYLATSLQTFMRPWLETAAASGGFIFTSWRQVQSEGGGTRTGRLSSTPNFQNAPHPDRIPKVFRTEKEKELPASPIRGLPPLPIIRGYILPDNEDHILIDRDYSQQEPRILAHFEDGPMMKMYLENPWVDFHDSAREKLLTFLHRDYPRKKVKNINLGIIYGEGIGSLAEKNDSTVEETRELKQAILSLYPGLKSLNSEMRRMADDNQPLRTWGGRLCLCEAPKIIKGQIRSYEYKMINTLVQGSAADCTKEAMIRYAEARPAGHSLRLSLHDEIAASVPRGEAKVGQKILRDAMESVEFDVPMLSEGTIGENFGAMIDFDKKGVAL